MVFLPKSANSHYLSRFWRTKFTARLWHVIWRLSNVLGNECLAEYVDVEKLDPSIQFCTRWPLAFANFVPILAPFLPQRLLTYQAQAQVIRLTSGFWSCFSYQTSSHHDPSPVSPFYGVRLLTESSRLVRLIDSLPKCPPRRGFDHHSTSSSAPSSLS